MKSVAALIKLITFPEDELYVPRRWDLKKQTNDQEHHSQSLR